MSIDPYPYLAQCFSDEYAIRVGDRPNLVGEDDPHRHISEKIAEAFGLALRFRCNSGASRKIIDWR